MSPDRQTHRVIAVGTALISLMLCEVCLSTAGQKSAESTARNSVVTPEGNVTTFTDPQLSSLFKTADCRLSDISDHHCYGMCGSVHFFCFQYTSQSDIQQIVAANGLRVLEKIDYSGMGIGPKWRSLASHWHQVPSSAAAYSGGMAGHVYFHLFVDHDAETAYLEAATGMP